MNRGITSSRSGWIPIGIYFSLTISILFVGCTRSPSVPFQIANAQTRPAEIPPVDQLTLATNADIRAASQVAADPAIQKAINDYLANPSRPWKIEAARAIGNYTLLWISFPGVADGGTSLVYDVKAGRIGWRFKGGELG